MDRRINAILLLFSLILGLGSQTWAGEIDPALDAVLKTMAADDTVPVIIHLTEKVDLEVIKDKDKAVRSAKIIKALIDKKDASQKALLKILKKNKIKAPISLWIINGVAAQVPVSLVDDLARLNGVEKVTLDAVITLPPEPAPAAMIMDTVAPSEWNIDAVRAPELWTLGYDGTGVVVAVLDSGADLDHPDIGPRYRGGSNSWYDPNGQHSEPYDAAGHGTQVLGLIMGGDAGGTASGVAPGAQWIAVKLYDDSGKSSLSKGHLAFQWVLDPDGDPNTADAPDIVNNSWFLWGTINACSDEFDSDIAVLKAADIAVVFAAGNTGPSAPSSVHPANSPGGFAVGAVDSNANIAFFSARGPSACAGDIYPEITAPGQSVRTADLTFGGIFPDSYAGVMGTSFSTPHVSGAMALLLNAMAHQGVDVTVSQLESAIVESATDLGAPGPDNDYGAGLLDVAAAYDWLLANSGSGKPGQLQFSMSEYSVNEGAGSVMVTVTRTDGDAGEVTVDYAAADGTATMDEDYAAASGTLFFMEGETSRTFPVTILDDAVFEGDEFLTLTLSSATGGAGIGYPDSAVLTIVDDDPMPDPDGDGDGYTADVDCDDSNPDVHPGALEIKHDGIDQDCNGYDLTIDITLSAYQPSTDTFGVFAKSEQGGLADLKITVQVESGAKYTQNMTWYPSRNRWQKVVNNFVGLTKSLPVQVTVFGPEGSASAPVALK